MDAIREEFGSFHPANDGNSGDHNLPAKQALVAALSEKLIKRRYLGIVAGLDD
jgi:hypothetical protein